MFRNLFCLFFILIRSLTYAENTLPLADTDGGSATIVHNAVSVISGAYIESADDLTLLGPEPLVFQRLYSSSDYEAKTLYNGWRHNYDSSIKLNEDDDFCMYTEKSGRTSKFKLKENKSRHSLLKFSAKDAKGYTNFGSGVLGGAVHAKNINLSYSIKSKTVTATNGAGTESYFKSKNLKSTLNLLSEKKANGHEFQYSYNSKGDLVQVQVLNKAGKVFSWLKFIDSVREEFKKDPSFEVHASDGRKILYKLQKMEQTVGRHTYKEYRITEIISPELPHITYEYRYDQYTDKIHICKKGMPNERYLCIDYHRKMKGEKPDFRINRVKRLRAPAGYDAGSIEIYRFDYINSRKNSLDGYTTVHDANNHLTHYGFTKEDRLDYIKKFLGNNSDNHQLYSLEKYLWDDEGSLICRYIKDQKNQVVAARTFDYDKKGNVIKDSFYGNLQGHSAPIQFKANATSPSPNGCEAWVVQYRYSEDNLLLEENEPNGKSIHYTYDKALKVLKSKLTLENGAVRLREFYDYDDNALVTCKINDNGSATDRNDLSGVTMRKIVRSYNSEVTPVGLPYRIDEFYYDFATAQEVLIKRLFTNYDIKGQILAKYFYDCHGRYLYSHLFEYDAHGNMILETNAAGDTIERGFNENNNLIFERGVSKDCYKNFTYDFMGRLIQAQEFHSDGTVHTTANSYDYMGNLVSTIDPFGRKTSYIYDELNRLVRTELPVFYDAAGQLIAPHISQEYDIFNNVISQTDALGNRTTKEYNVRGSPIKICHPAGSVEHFEYNLDGTMKKSVDKNGSYSLYSHDCFQRLLKKEHYSASGELLYVTSSTYNSTQKLTETDPEGVVTNYTYYDFGLLKSISKCDSYQEFEYDDCFRLAKTKVKLTDGQYKVTIQEYDILDRVIEERVENIEGQIQRLVQYVYDRNGNKTQVIQGGSLVTKNYFDSHQKLVKTIDPQGHVTHYHYNYAAFNKHGQMILEMRVTDPNGVQTLTQFGHLDKPEHIFKKNSMGQLIADKEIFYDAVGNIKCSLESAMIPDKVLRKVKNEWHYNSSNLLTSVVEASGDISQKTTQFKYNTFGEKTTLIKADGSEIHHTYDALGRLKTFYAGDGSYSYVYEYDKNDRLIKSHDQLLGLTTLKTYDPSGHLIEETLGTGLTVRYAYDLTGRPILLTLPDGSSVRYEYEGLNLKKVTRVSKDGDPLYTHDYLKHDLQGLLLKENQILEGGQVEYAYDQNGRLVNSCSNTFSESLEFDAVGNLTAFTMKNVAEEVESLFTYDDLNQLSSEKGAARHSYVHDSLYNCVDKDGVLQEVNILNQLLKTKDQAFTYDQNGNRISSENENSKINYAYDALDRLIKVSGSDYEYAYLYDSFNRRISKIKKNHSGDVLEHINYLYIGQNEVGAYKNDQLFEFRLLGTGKGAEIGATLAMELGSNIYIPIHDHNGNIVQLKEANTGLLAEFYRYSAFGEAQILDAGQNELQSSAIQNPWGFSSKRFDQETSLLNFGRRYYDPKTAKWMSPDPLGFDQGPNLYAYVNNNPLTHIDLYGLASYNFNKSLSTINYSSMRIQSDHAMINRFAQGVISTPGTIIKGIGDHVIPVPVIRDAFSTAGGLLSGEGFNWNHEWRQEKSTLLPPVGNITLPNHAAISLSGILNTHESSKVIGGKISEFLGGVVVHPVCYATRGLTPDLLKNGIMKLGYDIEAVHIAVTTIKACLERVGSGGTVDIYAHSMGGLITSRALNYFNPEELQQINVYTFGSAKIIDNKYLRSVTNYVNIYDSVPFIADPLGCLRGATSNYGNVKFLKSQGGYPLIDHACFDKTYEGAIRKEGLNFRKTHGI